MTVTACAGAATAAAAATIEANASFFILFHLLLLTDYFNFSRNRIESRLLAILHRKKCNATLLQQKIRK
jgi:hypothetical protein